MTKEYTLASLHDPEASPSSISSPIVYTPPSESSALSNTAAPQRRPSPLSLNRSRPQSISRGIGRSTTTHAEVAFDSDFDSDDQGDDMAERSAMHRQPDGRSEVPLLKEERGRPSYDAPGGSARPPATRTSTFRSRSPDLAAQSATKTKYTYAAFFLGLSLVSFVIQTETAVYIQKDLGWNKAYCMLYFTHGSWSLLWPFALLCIRIQKRKMPWAAFWRRHTYILRTTAQMVKTQDLHLTSRDAHESPIPYMLKKTAIVTTALTVAGGSWYLAVDLTSASDLTAIYNCSAFFAYAFSIPLLGDKLRFDKIFSVTIAIVGVMIIAYGDTKEVKEGEPPVPEAENRALGNVIIGIGSVLYGLYEVMYKKLACPPEGTSAGRVMIFAMTFGSCIGCFTLFVLWIPLPILHLTGLELFEFPQGEAAWMMAISVLANATFSGSFLVLISLTSPVLSSVAALLTIFLVAFTDWFFKGEALSFAAVLGGVLIIGAFFMLSWSTYREMNEERLRRLEEDSVLSESDE